LKLYFRIIKIEVIKIMNKKEQEEWNQQKAENRFNNVTEKKKAENQNQAHNVKKEGVDVNMRQL